MQPCVYLVGAVCAHHVIGVAIQGVVLCPVGMDAQWVWSHTLYIIFLGVLVLADSGTRPPSEEQPPTLSPH